MKNKINSIEDALDILGITKVLLKGDQKIIKGIIDANIDNTFKLLNINDNKDSSINNKKNIIYYFNQFFTKLIKNLSDNKNKNKQPREEFRLNEEKKIYKLLRAIKEHIKDNENTSVKEVNNEEAYLVSVIYILLKPNILYDFISKIIKYLNEEKIILLSEFNNMEKILDFTNFSLLIEKDIDTFFRKIEEYHKYDKYYIYIDVLDTEWDINNPDKYDKNGVPKIRKDTFEKMKRIQEYINKKNKFKATIDESLIVKI